MENEQIRGLDDLVKKFKGENVEILDKNISFLTAPGENYFSDMLKVDLTLKNTQTGVESVEQVVAKCVVTAPDAEPFMREMSVKMFKTEIIFYKDIIPCLQQFLKKHGKPELDIFPEMFAARLSLEDREEPDKDSLLILENLKIKGYVNIDRHKGFDLDGAKVLLADLANLHAVPLAIKILEPELFENKIVNKMSSPIKPDDQNGENNEPPFPFDLMRQVLKTDAFCRKNIDKLEIIITDTLENMQNNTLFGHSDFRKPFCTLIHNDMWVNNTMQIVDKEGKIIKNKFVDFQMYEIQPFTYDLVFFLITSVDMVTLENHFDYLLMFYHERVIKILESLNCDTTPYSYVKFMEQVKEAILFKFTFMSFMNFNVIFGKKGERADIEKSEQKKVVDTHPVAKNKCIFLFKKMVEHDWI